MLTCAQSLLFTMFQEHFFQGGRPLDAYRCRGVQISLFHFLFFHFGFFYHLVFLFGEGAGFIANNSIWEPQGEFTALSGGSPGSASRAVLHWKNNAFCICSLKLVAKSVAFQSTKICNKHCLFNANRLPMPLPKGLPKEAFEQPKIASWASGAPLGSRAPSWRSFLDFSGCISGLGGSLGYFLVAFGVSLVFFSNLHGLIFCKSLGITFVLHADVNLKHVLFAFSIFIF